MFNSSCAKTSLSQWKHTLLGSYGASISSFLPVPLCVLQISTTLVHNKYWLVANDKIIPPIRLTQSCYLVAILGCKKIITLHIHLIGLSAKLSLNQYSNLYAFKVQLVAFKFALSTGMIVLWDTSLSKVEDVIT